MASNQDHPAPRGFGLGYIIYQQVAGVLGAFALIAFLGHFVDLDWRGALADLVGMWDQYVRPAVKWLLDWTIIPFLKWLGWHIELSSTVRDYFAVGLTFALSGFRAQFWANREFRKLPLKLDRLGENDASLSVTPAQSTFWEVAGFITAIIVFISVGLYEMVLWPLALLFLVAKAVSDYRFWLRHDRSDYAQLTLKQRALKVLPLLYLALLLGANYLLLKPST